MVDPLTRFYEKLITYRSPGLHVSSLVHDCLRRSYYEQVYGQQFNALDQNIKFWVGRQLHDMAVLAEHEVALEWEGITGTADEYEDGILVDKKTTENDIPYKPSEDYVRQVEYYKVMLEAMGKPVTQAFIMYIKFTKPYKVALLDAPLRDSESIRQEMRGKKSVLEKADRDNTPPERRPGWLCNYCSFASICWKAGELEYHGERWGKAQALAGKGFFEQIAVDTDTISAKFSEEGKEYACFIDMSGATTCSCKDHQARKVTWCKHLLALLVEVKPQIGVIAYQKLVYGHSAKEEGK